MPTNAAPFVAGLAYDNGDIQGAARPDVDPFVRALLNLIEDTQRADPWRAARAALVRSLAELATDTARRGRAARKARLGVALRFADAEPAEATRLATVRRGNPRQPGRDELA